MIKRLIKYLFIAFSGLLAMIILATLLADVSPYQTLDSKNPVAPRSLDSTFFIIHLDSLMTEWGTHKQLPKGYELQALIALSYFPELKDVRIQFRYLLTKIPLASRPYFWSLFKPRDEWKFRIIISSESTKIFEPLLLKNLPFNAQVGIIAHELSHTLYYQNLDFRQLLKYDVLYATDRKFRQTHERSTDKQAIYHGLGWQLYDYVHFIRHYIPDSSSYMKSRHKEYMEYFYLSDQEVLDQMEQLKIYDHDSLQVGRGLIGDIALTNLLE